MRKENIQSTGRIRVITTKAGTKEVLRVSEWTSNLIMLGANTGKTIILQRLIGVNTYSLNLSHADMGTGSTAPSAGDTTLQAPVARAAVASGSISGNVATLQFFFADANLANGTYREFGSFIDGTGTVSTGKIFNHALFGVPYVKASGEDTTIEMQVTIT
ncbi:hypothetical protein IPJ70_04315 [Candidatus Campbellbacteria bacterium]|nr:MAG: hypothetical protein IPJ70_04315 [Candidatus Campbellbacteria bacterium]